MKKYIILFLCLFVLSGCKQKEETASPSASKSTTQSSRSTKKTATTLESSTPSESSVTETTTEDTQPAFEAFVGGWGVPQSGNLFFINADRTISGPDIKLGKVINQMDNITLYNTSEGKKALSFTMNGLQKELIKEFDGSVTASDGQHYSYLGNVSYDQYLAEKQ